MKLNQIPVLRSEDFPSQQSWISGLFVQLNPFFQAVSQAFDSNIDYVTNIKSVTRDYSISSFQPFNLAWGFKDVAPNQVTVIKAVKGSTPTILLPAWSYDSGKRTITVSQLVEITRTGVSALSGSYNFTIRATI